MKEDRVFHWTREPDPRWQQSLNRIAPPREGGSHLLIHWVPAYNRMIAQRWVIFECIPAFAVSEAVWATLDDPNKSDDPLIAWARDYLRHTGTVPTPIWVCQDNPMGHPMTYNMREKMLAEQGKIPDRPPMIGELDYNEPSDLTWEAIRRRSTLNRKIADAWEARRVEMEKVQRRQRWEMVREITDSLRDVVKDSARDAMQTARTVDRNAKWYDSGAHANVTDEHLDRYIETGQLNLTPIT